MRSECWLESLLMLTVRFSHLGIDSDIAALNKDDLWALYLHLSRLAED